MANDTAQTADDAWSALMEDDAQLDRLAREAVQEALQTHKRNGQSVVIWRDGQIVTLPPDEIPEAPTGEKG